MLLQHFLRLALLAFAALTVNLVHAHTFEDTGILGDKLQVRLAPKFSSGNLIGIDIYEIWTDAEVGHAVLSQRSYYRFDTRRVTEDREWYHLTGYLAEGVLEMENQYESQNWSITAELASGLDRAARLAADPGTPIEEIRKIYRMFRISPFSVKAGEKEREGQRRLKWLAGVQRIGQVEINLTRSPKYGNRFSAKLAN